MGKKKLEYEDKEKVEKIVEAYNKGYIKVCPKCGGFLVAPFVDEDYFANKLRLVCRGCRHEWGYPS